MNNLGKTGIAALALTLLGRGFLWGRKRKRASDGCYDEYFSQDEHKTDQVAGEG